MTQPEGSYFIAEDEKDKSTKLLVDRNALLFI